MYNAYSICFTPDPLFNIVETAMLCCDLLSRLTYSFPSVRIKFILKNSQELFIVLKMHFFAASYPSLTDPRIHQPQSWSLGIP